MPNSSSVSEFLLLAFADTRELQLLHFALFLGIYVAALLGNGLILTAVACDHRLHTPMYFFLLNLALLDLGSISTTVPKAMANLLWDTRATSYQGCAAQLSFYLLFFGAEYSLLTIMVYDRYIAICKPLHYWSLLGSRACGQMAAAAWGSGFLNAVLHTATTFSLPLCQGNVVDHFFCEIPQILKLSCSDAYLREVGALVFSVSLGFGCFIYIVVSYVQVFRAVLRMPSEQGRHKAFSTCLPHLAVVSLMVITATVAYLKPPSIASPSLDLVVSFRYSVVPPAVNPLIYSMRNKELKGAGAPTDLCALCPPDYNTTSVSGMEEPTEVITASELTYDDGVLCTNFCRMGNVHFTSSGSLDSRLFSRLLQIAFSMANSLRYWAIGPVLPSLEQPGDNVLTEMVAEIISSTS
ncbi:olfactory receptor 14C36-like [Mergus octosetaceus]